MIRRMSSIKGNTLFDIILHGANNINEFYEIASRGSYPSADVIKDQIFSSNYPTTDNIIDRLSLLYNTKYIRPDPRASLPAKENIIVLRHNDNVAWGQTFTISDAIIQTFSNVQFLELDISEVNTSKQAIPNLKGHIGFDNRKKLYFTIYEGLLDPNGYVSEAQINRNFALMIAIDFSLEYHGVHKGDTDGQAHFCMAEYAGFKAAKQIRLKYNIDTKSVTFNSTDNFLAFSHWNNDNIEFFSDNFCGTKHADLYVMPDYKEDSITIDMKGDTTIVDSSVQDVNLSNKTRYDQIVGTVDNKVYSKGVANSVRYIEKKRLTFGSIVPSERIDNCTICIPIPEYKSRSAQRNEFSSSTARHLKGIEFKLSNKNEMFYECLSGYSLRFISTLSLVGKSPIIMLPRVQYSLTMPIHIGGGEYTGGDITGARLVSVNIKLDNNLSEKIINTKTIDIIDNYWHNVGSYNQEKVVNFKGNSYGMFASTINFRPRRNLYTQSYYEPYTWWRGGSVLAMSKFKTSVAISPMPVLYPYIDYDKIVADGKLETSTRFSHNPLEGSGLNSNMMYILNPLNQYCLSINQEYEGMLIYNENLMNKIDLTVGNSVHLQTIDAWSLIRRRLFMPNTDNKFTNGSVYINMTPIGNDVDAPPSGVNFTSMTNVMSKIELNPIATYQLPIFESGYNILQTIPSVNIIESDRSTSMPIV